MSAVFQIVGVAMNTVSLRLSKLVSAIAVLFALLLVFGLIAAVGAKTVAGSFLEAALLTCNGLGGQFFSAILTKHGDVPAFSSVF